MSRFTSVLAFGALLLAVSCKQPEKTSPRKDVLADDIDSTVRPASDFFDFANGGWIRRNEIPADQSSWGIGNLVIEENQRRLREIAEKAAQAGGSPGTANQLIGDFWSTAMDSAAVEANGLRPLKPYLDRIDSLRDLPSLIRLVTELKKIGSSTLFSDFVTQDDRNSDVMTYKLWQGGIGLPERAYYFKQDSATVAIRKQYLRYISTLLNLAGQDSAGASAAASRIMALETRLAAASRKLEDLRDPDSNYHKMAIRDLHQLGRTINWPAYLAATGVTAVDSVIVGQPEFFKALDKVLTSTPLPDWKAYLRFNLLNDFAAALPERFGVASFDFYRLFSGASVRKPRWKRVITSEEGVMGELLGQLYVKAYFDQAAKKRYSDLVEAIRQALHDRISRLTWMSDTTKQKAFAKLAAMKKKVGYPDKWKDFSAMKIGRESYVQNLIQAHSWWHAYEIAKLGKPVNRDEWGMYPQTYNAEYNPSNNEITLPAGIFTVPGYRDEELDDALVYGYAGASTIGHEITHGFDDEGRHYDARGNLTDWWTPGDAARFNQRADVMVRQFSAYEPIRDYHINGKATLGENIADLGGVLLGLEAFQKTEAYRSGKKIHGMDPLQRYFLGYSLGWLEKDRPELLRSQILTDVHAPAKYRVNGPFSDVDAFYSAFGVRPGDPMFRPDSLRVRIW